MPHLLQRKYYFLPIIGLMIISSCASLPQRKPSQDDRRMYVEEHLELRQVIKEAIIQGKVINGMTFDDVRAAWGEPDKISTSEDSKFLDNDEVMWEYNRLFLIPIFVDFSNGIVVNVADDFK